MNETYNHVSMQMQTGGRGVFKIKYLLCNEIYRGQRFNTGVVQMLIQGAAGNWFQGWVVYRRMNGIYYSDLLLLFTYIPGTVGHIGYGSLFIQPDESLSFF